MLFRGLLQFELISRTGLGLAASLGLSSLIFGLLHAVTPLYAIMAALASVYFGLLYIVFDNLAVPIACHSLYDIGALLYAHWTVSRLTDKERAALASWNGPTTPPKESNNEQRPLP
jgi:membrane protease YdiL (CAAX protease family)